MFEKSLIPSVTRLRLPQRYGVDQNADGLRIRRLDSPPREVGATLEGYRSRGPRCRRLRAVTEEGETLLIEFAAFGDDYGSEVAGVIRARGAVIDGPAVGLEGARYRGSLLSLSAVGRYREAARDGWSNGIAYPMEQAGERGELRPGLRGPQAGALHAIASHWTLGEEPAIVVMPTGTGKTEVMMAASVASASERVLVVVPTDALREQTGRKYEQYGLLRGLGVIGDIPAPVVGYLGSTPTFEHFEAMQVCNVVVTTMSSISRAEEDARKAFAKLFGHVFFDEAHHIEASTWKRFQQDCDESAMLLFTATPFRNDGKALEGKIIYNFPLSRAQEQGYFSPIGFKEVFEADTDLADRAIAETAVSRLREDRAAGHEHIVMARAATIKAAESLYERVYKAGYAEFDPVLIHSRTPARRAVVDAIRQGRHKIVVCVDMFGEGFDLPSLKIAALHSVHKSLGVTLQFIGRFARTAAGAGRATFVANTAEDGVPEALEGLYQESADWNVLVPDLSFDAIDPQARLSELASNLEPVGPDDELVEVSTLALRPKISAQVYRTTGFRPERYVDAFAEHQRVHQPRISTRDNLLTLVVNQSESVDWTNSRQITVETWDLYVAYYDPLKGLLYMHSSRRGDSTKRLANAVAVDPELIQGEEAFKAFAGLRRLILHSVGLSGRSRNVRYQMFAGLDVSEAIDPVLQQSKMKSNVMGIGYEQGRKISVGCSRKGKIWSLSSGSLADWRRWCDEIGSKLSDAGARPDDFLDYTLVPRIVDELPDAHALLVDWPDQLFESSSFRLEVKTGDETFDFHDCELRMLEWRAGGPSFSFCLVGGERIEARFELTIGPEAGGESTYAVRNTGGIDVDVVASGRREPGAAYFSENPPLVRLADGSQLSGNTLLRPRSEQGEVFDRTLIESLDWSSTDFAKESRWKEGRIRRDSIQYRFMEHLEQGPATFIIDDDDQGESADVVSIEETEEQVVVYLWHCKYSRGADPGRRFADLHEVCGQAQKSAKWTWGLERIVQHLMVRESRHRRGRDTRFLRGSARDLVTLRKEARRKFVRFRIGVIQPGLSRANVPVEHLTLIGATNSFVQTVTDHRLLVFASE